MSDTAQEPSMEEILASIRRIISADSEESPAGAAADGDDDVLDLSAMEAPAEAAQEPADAPAPDRWGGTRLDDAVREKHQHVEAVLRAQPT